MLKQLVHDGILVLQVPIPSRLELVVRGERRELSPGQIEMAMAWAKKQGTPYVEDSTFVRNFMRDFSTALDVNPSLTIDEVDFGPALAIVQAERAAKTRLTKEEKKALAAQRKEKREQLKEQYGYAIVDDECVELGNYATEPSGIFMGRGKHPLRGKWKEGPQQSDVTLNLSPDADHPPGDWGEIVWQPESLWVARWKDKLSDKLKYVWLSDTAPIKQEREAAKFDQALHLDQNLAQVRAHIEQGLTDSNAKRRMVATACHLIDVLCLRVGDEKDADEADTVGATTLRPEHVTLHSDGTSEFRFLGKDSVLWHKKISLLPVVRQNLEELIQEARPSNSAGNGNRRSTHKKPQIFPTIKSSDVNAYLFEVLPGVTAKVFRTHHATRAVRDSLLASEIEAGDPEYKKWAAVSHANLEAAVLCNHYKTAPANWRERRQRANERQNKRKERVAIYRSQVREAKETLTALRREAREKKDEAKTSTQRDKLRVRYAKKIERAKKKVETAENRLQRARVALDKAKTKDAITVKKRTWNLSTSLKSYIDPRVLYEWGQQVDYDLLERYSPKALQRKFAWVREREQEDGSPEKHTDGESVE
ncbi:MAG: DNA topoisomerase I [Anaerolineae bacterium]